MKYSEFKPQHDAIEGKLTEIHGSTAELQTASERLLEQVERTWSLGATSRPTLILYAAVRLRDMPHLILTYDSRGFSQSTFSMMTGYISAEQWRMVAAVKEKLTAWVVGQIDELPPSGEWPK